MPSYEQMYHTVLIENESLRDERDSLANALRECEVDRKADAATVLEMRAQLAEARRVPEDAELDALVTAMASEPVDQWLYTAIDAITALRRRIGELEKDRERLEYYLRNDPENVGTWSPCCRRNLNDLLDAARANEEKPK